MEMGLALCYRREDTTSKLCIKIKYGVEAGGWFIRSHRGSYGVCLQKAISKDANFHYKGASFSWEMVKESDSGKTGSVVTTPVLLFPNLFLIATKRS